MCKVLPGVVNATEALLAKGTKSAHKEIKDLHIQGLLDRTIYLKIHLNMIFVIIQAYVLGPFVLLCKSLW